jgi:hypothetical protein
MVYYGGAETWQARGAENSVDSVNVFSKWYRVEEKQLFRLSKNTQKCVLPNHYRKAFESFPSSAVHES